MTSDSAKDAAITALYILAIVFAAAAIIIIVVEMATTHTVSTEVRDNAIALGVTGLVFLIVTFIATNYIVHRQSHARNA